MAFTDFSLSNESPMSKTFNDSLKENFEGLHTNITASITGSLNPVPHEDASVVYWTTTGTNDLATLSAGKEGEHLFIIMVVDGGNGLLFPTDKGGYSTITFSDVGDSIHLLYTNSKWYIVGKGGLTTGPQIT